MSVNLLQQSYAQKSEVVREQLVYQQQGTADDKALCIIEIVIDG
jgi:hypothetical protein